MKRLFSLFITCLLPLTMAGSLKTAKDTTAMDVSALRWLSTISQGRDLMDNDHDAEGATENEQALLKRIREMKSEGCDAIRLSVCWDTSFYDSRCRSFAPAWLDHIQRIVDDCLCLNLKVILNFHQTEMPCDYTHQEENNKILTDLWRQTATRFRNYDGRLAFSGIDGVKNADDKFPTEENTAVIDSYNQTFVSAVRKTGGRNVYRNLFIQPLAGSISNGLAFLHFPLDGTPGRLAVEFHDNPTDDGIESCQTKRVFDRINQLWIEKGYGVILCSADAEIVGAAQEHNITMFLKEE
ncbi:MAG: cellulase family glycosylhydrolase [Prevotellaceae bacterium]|nr:cellulase family glycosylhydrolase [Prevotellaceae bacterium]